MKTKNKNPKWYTADFETTTDLNDCRVWLYGIYDIFNETVYNIGNNIESFITTIKDISGATLFFHNEKFDGKFIFDYILKNGWEFNDDKKPPPKTFNCLISDTGVFYSIELTFSYQGNKRIFVKIWDSLKKIPMTVEQMGKEFGDDDEQKLEIDYHKYRPIDYLPTEQEIEYLIHDIKIPAKVLKAQHKAGLTHMTTSSDALHDCKKRIGLQRFNNLFPQLDFNTDAEIRQAYKGGWVYVKKSIVGKDIENGIVIDKNSMYPDKLLNYPLPCGVPVPFSGEYEYDEQYPLYIQHFECYFKIKDKHLPTIQMKHSPRYNLTEYVEESTDIEELYLTGQELELFKHQYDTNFLKYIGGYKFKQCTGEFDNFVHHWGKQKEESPKGSFERYFAKLMMNGLTGKFGTNPNPNKKIPYLHNDVIKYKTLAGEERKTLYVPLVLFITAYSRVELITLAQQLYDNFCYADTDSLHLADMTIEDIPDYIPLDDTKIGAWDCESIFTKARYLRPKTYIELVQKKDGEKWDKKLCGLPDDGKRFITWDNFHIGLNLNPEELNDKVKLRPKTVAGGCVLVDAPFKIR